MVKQDKKAKIPDENDKEHEVVKKELEDYKSKYLRALADYQNFENRVREEKKELVTGANKHFILKLLPFLDNLNKAEVFFKDEGLKLIKQEFLDLLKSEGVEEINPVGQEFDPQIAEAVDIKPGEEDNKILEVLRKGYTLEGKVLQVAQVTVSKKIIN